MKKIIWMILSIVYVMAGVAGEARIVIESSDFTEKDTLELYVWNETGGILYKAPNRLFRVSPQNGICTFTVDSLHDVAWMSLNFSYQKVDNQVLYGIFKTIPLEAGDDILIQLYKKKGKYQPVGNGYEGGEPMFEGSWGCVFRGLKGGKKMDVALNLQKICSEPIVFMKPLGTGRRNIEDHLKVYDLKFQSVKEYLDLNKEGLTEKVRTILLYESAGKIGSDYIQTIVRQVTFSNDEKESSKLVKPKIDSLLNVLLQLNESEKAAALRSPGIISYWQQLVHFNTNYDAEEPNRLASSIYWVRNNIKDVKLRDRLWLELMLSYFYVYADKGLYDLVMDNMQSPYGLQRLEKFEALVNPDTKLVIDLPDQNGRRYTIDDFKGKVILLDFWYMGCGPCRAYMEIIIRPLQEKMKGNPDFQVVLISLDDRETLSRAIDAGILPEGAVALYTDNLKFKHPLMNSLGINSYPYPMLIDQNGRIVTVGKRLKTMAYLLEDIAGLLEK